MKEQQWMTSDLIAMKTPTLPQADLKPTMTSTSFEHITRHTDWNIVYETDRTGFTLTLLGRYCVFWAHHLHCRYRECVHSITCTWSYLERFFVAQSKFSSNGHSVLIIHFNPFRVVGDLEPTPADFDLWASTFSITVFRIFCFIKKCNHKS